MAFPVLWWLHPRFLRKPSARGLVIGLLIWKLATALALTQGGWCAKFLTQTPLVEGGSRIQRSWDLRTDWRQSVPRCSAIIARPYPTLADFPVWFINLLDETGRPPQGTFTMEIDGYLTVTERGALSLSIGEGMRLKGSVGTAAISSDGMGTPEVFLGPGVHQIHMEATLSGSSWRLVPLWNGKDLWSSGLVTVDAPSSLDRILWKPGSFVTPLLIGLLVLSWAASGFMTYRPNFSLVGWSVAASLGMASIALDGRYERFAVLLLFACLVIPVSHQLRNLRGAFLLLGPPWLSFFVVKHISQVGQFTLYSLWDDWWLYQVKAHRIFMQGYWLEGGEKTFWNQPLYRWINGALHIVFGDSSVGEAYWDALFLLLGALFSFHIVKTFAGWRWGLLAGSTTLFTFALGPIWYLVGRGLTEISAAGWAYLAGFYILRARLGRWSSTIMAGLFATLMFYTRLNHLPFAVAMIALSLPLTVPARSLLAVRSVLGRVSYRLLFMYLGCFTLGLGLFALRTWYYTGVFSVFYGTQRGIQSTGLGTSTLFSPSVWRTAIDALLVVVTVHEPASLNVRGLPVTAGVGLAFLALMQVPLLSLLPLGPSLLCLGALVSTLLARGIAYPGRFSVHLVPVATAISTCALALVVKRFRPLARSLPVRAAIMRATNR